MQCLRSQPGWALPVLIVIMVLAREQEHTMHVRIGDLAARSIRGPQLAIGMCRSEDGSRFQVNFIAAGPSADWALEPAEAFCSPGRRTRS